MPSIIFVTLNDGEYPDEWISELNTLLQTGESAGHRLLRWCGQRRGKRDHLVKPGTLVATRDNRKTKAFTIVGEVAEITCIREQIGKTCGVYKIVVQIAKTERVIPRADGDRYTHWTVLRELGILHRDAQPQGIYSG